MSIERELLQRIVADADTYFEIDMEFITEIKELLAQPEQTEQKPVAWMYDLDMMIHPISNTRSQRFGALTVIDPTNRQQDAVNIRPLYTAPPKREPFGPEERQRLSKAYSTQAEQVAFEEGIIFAEISYGIGGEE